MKQFKIITVADLTCIVSEKVRERFREINNQYPKLVDEMMSLGCHELDYVVNVNDPNEFYQLDSFFWVTDYTTFYVDDR